MLPANDDYEPTALRSNVIRILLLEIAFEGSYWFLYVGAAAGITFFLLILLIVLVSDGQAVFLKFHFNLGALVASCASVIVLLWSLCVVIVYVRYRDKRVLGDRRNHVLGILDKIRDEVRGFEFHGPIFVANLRKDSDAQSEQRSTADWERPLQDFKKR